MATFRAQLILVSALLIIQSCATTKGRPQGPSLSLNELSSGSKATVLVWWSTGCPCVSRYQSRMEELARRYSAQGVAFFAIASNSDDDATRVQIVAQDRNFELPIKMDEGGHLASELGVRTTPTVVILDATGLVKYRGWMDNERYPGDASRIAYAENALNEILANSKVSAATSPIYGCKITKRLRQAH